MPSDNGVTTFEMRTQRPTKSAEQTAYGLLFLVCLGHFLNDGIQSVIPAALPILRDAHGLTFTQVGLITLVIQVTSSLLQPLVGLTTDKHPTKYMLAVGMCCTLVGLVALSQASVFASMLLAVAFLGFGSAVFHPEATRIAQFASGGRKGLAQSVFQVGGNAGMALGPLAAAFVVIPYGQASIAWFGIAAGLAAVVMLRVGTLAAARQRRQPQQVLRNTKKQTISRPLTVLFVVLFLLMFSKQVYIACLQNYLTFYLIDTFGMAISTSQYVLFGFLAMSAVGTIAGGPLTDRFGSRAVILFSILGAAPFTLLIPHVGLQTFVFLALAVSFIMSSAFSAILVCALNAAPNHVGLVSGVFFGVSFGMGGIATALFGSAADAMGLQSVFTVIAFLPLIGLAAFLLPKKSLSASD